MTVLLTIKQEVNNLSAFLISLSGAAFWGLSGTMADVLFTDFSMNPLSVLALRMLISGIVMLIIFRPKFPKENFKLIVLYAILSVVLQLSYLETINLSNAATATFLQFLYFPIVVIYEIFRKKLILGKRIVTGMLCALSGIVLLTLDVNGSGLSVSPLAILIGMICATSAAVYTIISAPLVQRYGSIPLVSWGFFLGSLISFPIGLPSIMDFFGHLQTSSLPEVSFLIMFVAIFGTIIAFSLYSFGLNKISASSAAVAGTMEPISASLSSSIILGQFLSPFQYLGGALIILSMVFSQLGISRQKPRGNRVRRLIKIRMR